MTIIDLFVKIANKEEVPKEIKWRGDIYEYSSIAAQYYIKDRIHNVDNSLRAALYDFIDLNNEIEIIEEDKEFEDIREIIGEVERDKTLSYDESQDGIVKNFNMLIKWTNILVRNQNKIIDEVNKLKGEK